MRKNLSKKRGFSILLVALGLFVFPHFTLAQTADSPPDGFIVEAVASGLNLPTTFEYAPDGHIFIAEKSGIVRIFEDGALNPIPVIELPNVNTYGDRGLMGLALDPDFETNGYMYLLYTYENTPLQNVEGKKTAQLIRVTIGMDHAALSGSEVVLLGSIVGDVNSPSCEDFPVGADCIASDGSSHTVDDLAFGPDGKLYVSIGDAASFDVVDPLAHRAQSLDSLNGKVLRINKDGSAPTDNPYYNGDPTANRSKVWNLGLRNPFRFSFRPANGSLYIGDVGWFTAEEVNLGVAGANFGWPCHEGLVQTPGYACTSAGALDPLYSYSHNANGAGSVTGGMFYTSTQYPALYQGTYFFGDFAQNWIKRLVVDENDNLISVENFIDEAGGPVAFGSDLEGNINYLSIYTGELRRIVHTTSNRSPIAKLSAYPTSGLLPLTVLFSSASSSDPDGDPTSFTWDFGDGTASNEANPVHIYTVNGTYTVQLSVGDNKGGVGTDTVTITAGNEAPTATIVNPPGGSLYEVGQIIPLFGEGIDFEDGILGEDAYSWRIILHHNIHSHVLQQLVGSSPSFTTPDSGDDDIYIEVELTVTDSIGLAHTVSIELHPATPSTVDPYLDSVTVNPASLAPGTPMTVTALVGNNGTIDPILIDIEIYDSVGDKVAQTFYDNEVIINGEIRSFTLDFTPALIGDYRVAVGLIRPNWNGLYEWINEATIFTVTDGWLPVAPNGALYFDGVDDYVETGIWNIEDSAAFTFDVDFVADSFNGDIYFIAKSAGIADADFDWAYGIREVTPTEGELLFQLRTDDNVLTTLTSAVSIAVGV